MRPGWKAFRWTTSGYDRRMQEPSEWLSEYQSEADAAPQLTASEEAALLAAFSAGDRSASQALLVAHKRLVLAVARKYIRTGPPALETLVRAGDAALHTALDKFDPSKGPVSPPMRLGGYGRPSTGQAAALAAVPRMRPTGTDRSLLIRFRDVISRRGRRSLIPIM